MSILAALLFPVFASARAAARRTTCISNLRQLGLGLQMYKQDWGEFPLQMSDINSAYVKEPKIFVCPNDPLEGQHAGNPRLEGNLYLPTGVSYDYVPRWQTASDLGWWGPPPAFGNGKWDDLTPIADCQWHWATTFNTQWATNQKGARGWQMILTAGANVRKLRVEDPIDLFTPDRYR
jgi:type II secretory pathway pseudopilin PulG